MLASAVLLFATPFTLMFFKLSVDEKLENHKAWYCWKEVFNRKCILWGGKKSAYEGFNFDTLFCNEILIQTEYIVSVIFTSVNRKGYAQQHVVFKLRIKHVCVHISSYFVTYIEAAAYSFQML